MQAAVRIEASEDEGRERLARYCGRPPFAIDRLSVLPDGRVAYALKVPTSRATHRVMTPVEFLARLAALVPPPRYPLVRYHGVLAPHSAWRGAVVPRPPRDTEPDALKPVPSAAHTPLTDRPAPHAPAPDRMPAPPSIALISPSDIEITPQGISVRHLDRLLDGLLLATSPRVDWARLLRRTFGFDVLACARCQGRLRLMSAITDQATVRRILEHLGIPATAPPMPRCRDPAGDDGAACTSPAPPG